MPSDTRLCFVASPIGDEGSEIRRRADRVYEIIRRAIKPHGFVPVRADAIAAPGLITHQLIRHLFDDPLVIADLSGANPNVYYELAIRHAVAKPCVQIMGKGESIPFDLRELRTIIYDPCDQYEAEISIGRAVEACFEPGFEAVSPLSYAGRTLHAS